MPKYREIPRSGSKAKDGERRGGKNDGNNNGQLRIATPPRVAHAKLPGPKVFIVKKLFRCPYILTAGLFCRDLQDEYYCGNIVHMNINISNWKMIGNIRKNLYFYQSGNNKAKPTLYQIEH